LGVLLAASSQSIYNKIKKQGSIDILIQFPQEKAILAPYRPVSIIEFWICLSVVTFEL
jgi:hypothetical protein